MAELRAENLQISESSGTIGRSKGASVASSQQQISVTVVTEFVRWNEEAISRCTLLASQVIFVPSIFITSTTEILTNFTSKISEYPFHFGNIIAKDFASKL